MADTCGDARRMTGDGVDESETVSLTGFGWFRRSVPRQDTHCLPAVRLELCGQVMHLRQCQFPRVRVVCLRSARTGHTVPLNRRLMKCLLAKEAHK